jgi:hypothetical protein
MCKPVNIIGPCYVLESDELQLSELRAAAVWVMVAETNAVEDCACA